jgi:hypothetical protein
MWELLYHLGVVVFEPMIQSDLIWICLIYNKDMLIFWLWPILSHNCTWRDFNMLMFIDFQCCIFVIIYNAVQLYLFVEGNLGGSFAGALWNIQILFRLFWFSFPPYVGEVIFCILIFFFIVAILKSSVFLSAVKCWQKPFPENVC